MDAYLWVTDDVLHKIKTLDGERDAKIKKAKHIVDRIERRDLYKMIGEKRVVWGITNGSSVFYYSVIVYRSVKGWGGGQNFKKWFYMIRFITLFM